jgi:hypothetical protein
MRRHPALDTAAFKDFDAVHACLSRSARRRPRIRNLGLGLIRHVIELLFLSSLKCRATLVCFLQQRTCGPKREVRYVMRCGAPCMV